MNDIQRLIYEVLSLRDGLERAGTCAPKREPRVSTAALLGAVAPDLPEVSELPLSERDPEAYLRSLAVNMASQP